MDNAKTKSFLEDLQQQLRVYREMMELNTRQRDLLSMEAGANAEELMEVVSRKQTLMHEVSEIEARLKPIKDDWHEMRQGLPEKVRDFAARLLDELASTVKSLISMEDEAHQMLEEKLAIASKGMKDLQQKSQVNRAYSAYGSRQQRPKFIDERTDGEV